MSGRLLEQLAIDFAAPTLTHPDMVRLGRQLTAVTRVMASGEWLTLAELSEASGAPEASASARLRDLRRPRWGGHTVERRRRHGEGTGLWEYRLRVAVA